ncbi:MAG: radical SAM family heme chaperone HemW [Candidatus Eremiobacteraeota bacterium]|nr:radical SAM family heme chaperone HemW [Candidatus Eremiobacteraeota bacterium]
MARNSSSVYVHLPFCDRICPYCDFAVVEFKQERVARYLAALHQELASCPQPAAVSSVYLGGGTPSAHTQSEIASLLAALFAHFGIERGSVECTLEANPSRNASALAGFRAAGVTRLSIGVQSFEDLELLRLGREHSARDAKTFVTAARKAGFANVNIDLIAGVPDQTSASFARTLERAIACESDHVSVYALTIEEGTPYANWFARRPERFPNDDRVADLLEQAESTLEEAGYVRYEISNYAKPGCESVHNLGYWRQQDCVALGMSASGYDDGLRYRNVRGFEAYCDAIERGGSAREDEERLSTQARIGEAAMLALRTREGIRDSDFRDRFGIEARSFFSDAVNKCRQAGLLEENPHGVRLSPRGRLLANTACSEFLHPSFLPAPAGLGQTTS